MTAAEKEKESNSRITFQDLLWKWRNESRPIAREELEFIIEMLIDRCTLDRTLDALSNVCEEKAAHIEENYGDKELAVHWRKLSRTFSKITCEV